MKLFYGGYGKYKFYTVAKTEEEAIENIKVKHSLQALPVAVEVIDEIDGYKIIAANEEPKEVEKPVKGKKAGAK